MRQGRLRIAEVFNLNTHILVVLAVALCKIGSVLKVTCLPANADSRFEIEREFLFVFHLILFIYASVVLIAFPLAIRGGCQRPFNKPIQRGYIFQLGIAVQEQRGVVRVGQTLVVKLLKIGDEIIDTLRVKKLMQRSCQRVGAGDGHGYAHLANDIAGLGYPDSLYKLIHGALKVTFGIEVVSILAKNVCQ